MGEVGGSDGRGNRDNNKNVFKFLVMRKYNTFCLHSIL